jgi:hypothetical protein
LQLIEAVMPSTTLFVDTDTPKESYPPFGAKDLSYSYLSLSPGHKGSACVRTQISSATYIQHKRNVFWTFLLNILLYAVGKTSENVGNRRELSVVGILSATDTFRRFPTLYRHF